MTTRVAAIGAAHRLTLAAGVVLLLSFLVGAFVVASAPTTPPSQGIDDYWRELLAGQRSSAMTWLARALHAAGTTIGTTVAGLALAAYWLVRRNRALAVFVLVSAVTVRIVTNLAKHGVDRPRPPQRLVEVAGDSFPSGHVSSTTVLAAVVAIVLAHRGRLWWGVALTAVAALVMAWDRTYLSVHWLSDTVAATALGIGVPLVLWPLFARRATATATPPAAPARTPPPPRR